MVVLGRGGTLCIHTYYIFIVCATCIVKVWNHWQRKQQGGGGGGEDAVKMR